MSLRIRNATLLNPTPSGLKEQPETSLRIKEDRIEEIGTRLPEADHDLNANGSLLPPGFVNAHGHAPMTLLRGYAEDLPLRTWLKQRIWPTEAHLKPDHVAAGARLAILEMLANGITAFADMYLFPEETAKAAIDANIRCLIGANIVDATTPEGPPDQALKRAETFLKEHPPREDGLVSGSLAPHSAYACKPETLEACSRLAKEHGAQLQVHAHETRREVYSVKERTGKRPLELLDDQGCLVENTLVAHGGWVTKQEAKRIGETGACLVHCPTANMKLATGGYAPVPEVLEHGGRVLIGTDGPASNNTIDLLLEARQAALVQKQHRWDATLLPADRLLRMMTRDAAEALGFPGSGRVEEGAVADLAVVSRESPGMVPMHDAPSGLVYAATGRDVIATVVGGRLVYVEGSWRTMDAGAVMEDAVAKADDLVGAADSSVD